MCRRLVLRLAIAVLLPTCTRSAYAANLFLRECLTSQDVRMGWAPGHELIPYFINPSEYPARDWDPDFNLIHAAFRTWEQATWGRVRFSYQGTTTRDRDPFDGQNTISFGVNLGDRDFAQTCVVMSPETFVVNGRSFHAILEADIVFNTNQAAFRWASPGVVGNPNCVYAEPPRIDVQSVATHEIGHVIGLGHTQPQHSQATMYYPDRTCDLSHVTLDADDIAGVRLIYPPPANAALFKTYTITTTGTYEATEHSGGEITDGNLSYDATPTDGCAGWRNDHYNELLRVKIAINLGERCTVHEILYNPGNVQRADTWNADRMITPFGDTPTVPGLPFQGAWTIHTGELVMDVLEITLEKSRTSATTDWLFVGEIECMATPIVAETILASNILGPNNVNADPAAVLGSPDEIPVSLGVGGSVSLDLGTSCPLKGLQAFMVHEGTGALSGAISKALAATDTVPEGYGVYASADAAVWEFLGNRVGSGRFDLMPASAALRACGARYLRIVDDGDGDPDETSPGVEVDGISLLDSVPAVPRYPVARITTSPPVALEGSPAWAPDASGFFFHSGSPPQMRFLAATGGSSVDLGFAGYDPAVSPDGTRLAYANRTSSTSLLVRSLSTGATQTLWSSTNEGVRSPSWSPDGTWIAFALDSGVFRIRATGGEPTQITSTTMARDVRWSPDPGWEILYTERVGWEDSLPCSGSPRREIHQLVMVGRPFPPIQLGRSTGTPTWSPRGGAFACVVRDASGNSHLEAVYRPPNGWGSRPYVSSAALTAGPGNDAYPAWMPRDTRILFGRSDAGDTGVFQVRFDDTPVSGVEPGATLSPVTELILNQNHPNPFNPTTIIRFATPSPSRVLLTIYDVAGRRVVDVLDRPLPAGWHEASWNGRDASNRPVSSGVYFYRIHANGQTQSRRMVVLR